MADHLDAPGLKSPAMDARVDITDHYAFQKPDHPDRTILILNVNPLAPAHAAEFRSDAVYETLVDINGDAEPEIVFQYLFTAKNDRGEQFATVLRTDLTGVGPTRDRTVSLATNAPVSLTSEAHITQGHQGVQFFAGIRSDPFFFDLLGFLNGLKFTGADFFIDKNVFGIALDIPSTLLGSNPKVGIWTRTRVPMTLQPDRLTQVTRWAGQGSIPCSTTATTKTARQPSEQRSRASTKAFAKWSWERHLEGVPEPLRASFVRYLECCVGTHVRATISHMASRLAHFGRLLARLDPDLTSLADLDRQQHIEPFLQDVATARHRFTGAPLSASERRRRIQLIGHMLNAIAEWGWPEAPARRLIFARDVPRLPRALPRYIPPDADRRLVRELDSWPNRLRADALLLMRATGLRVGELVDLELGLRTRDTGSRSLAQGLVGQAGHGAHGAAGRRDASDR